MTTRVQHVVNALQLMYPEKGWRIDGDIGINDEGIVLAEDNAFDFFYRKCTYCSSDMIDVVGKKVSDLIPLIDRFPIRPIPFQFSEILYGIHHRLAKQFGGDKADDIIRGLSNTGVVNEIFETFILAKVLMQKKMYMKDKITFCLRVLCVNNMLQIVEWHRYNFNVVTNIDGGNIAIIRGREAGAMEDMYKAGFMKIGGMNVPSIQ